MPLPATPKQQSWIEAERHETRDYARQHLTDGGVPLSVDINLNIQQKP